MILPAIFRPMRLFRLLKIASVASRFGLDEMVLEHEPSGRLVRIANALQFWRNLSAPRAERLRLALSDRNELSARLVGQSAPMLRLREQICKLGAELLGVPADAVEFDGKEVFTTEKAGDETT